ncbi:inositol monophosphatase family protein [Eremococcus coleocola]|uniref:Inositol monophosphatase family protein n=1 Tax=Eremococcus coleocola ACS-139-V-Col8 TaxID=908337 RepID=E4KNG3_9LACT|nr:inositol monophosphatase family protein [Eremococcus coleocola]EFR31500.1 inositol monophosphatase family protein [Eremococcus coleocola ACS-139-V-Col8]
MNYQRHHLVQTWIAQVGNMLRTALQGELEIEEKSGRADLVTQMDKAVEAYLIDQIHHYFPNDQILGEEGHGHNLTSTQGVLWIIDPIDGTLNFVKQANNFGTMIGIFEDGQAQAGYIYDVMKDDLYYGINGEGVFLNDQPLVPTLDTFLADSLLNINQYHLVGSDPQIQALVNGALGVRGYGSAALEIISILRGEASIYYASRLQPWDFAAGLAIFKELGLKVTDRQGQALDLLEASTVVFASPQVHQEAIQLLNA